MSHSDVAKVSGLARSTVIAITNLPKWDTLSLRTIDAFSRACGVDLLAPNMSLLILRKKQMGFMRHANPAQLKMYARLLNGYTQT